MVSPNRRKWPWPRKTPSKIPVNHRAAVARIKRALKQRGQRLHCSRRNWRSTFAVIDAAKGAVVAINVDLEALAHEIGALQPWETIISEARTYPPGVTIEPVKQPAKRTTKKKVPAND